MEPETSGPEGGVNGLERALDARLNSIDSARYRQNTDSTIRRLFNWLHDNRDVTALQDVESLDCRRWVQDLTRREREGEITASTAHAYYTQARSTFAWWVDDERIATNPMRPASVQDELPNDDGSRDSQFWSADARDQLLTYCSKRAHDALEDDSRDEEAAFRDRALVYLLAETGIRGAELARVHDDPDRTGLTWADVDFDRGLLEVFGKNRTRQSIAVPERALNRLRRYRDLVDHPDSWPVFPTGDATTRARRLRTALKDDGLDEDEIERIVADAPDVTAALREQGVDPPALTTEGTRSIMKRLCDAAGVDVDGEYLKPHGGRRALGDQLYDQSAELAQETLRHQSIETTHESYREVDHDDIAGRVGDVLYEESGTDGGED